MAAHRLLPHLAATARARALASGAGEVKFTGEVGPDVKLVRYEIYFDFKLFKTLFNVTKLTQEVVDSINCLFDTFNTYTTNDSNNPVYVAYMLGTTWHETAHTMLPIMEKGGRAYLSKYDTGKLAKN